MTLESENRSLKSKWTTAESLKSLDVELPSATSIVYLLVYAYARRSMSNDRSSMPPPLRK